MASELDNALRADEQQGAAASSLDALGTKARAFLKTNYARIMDLFRQMDASGDGLISRLEFEAGMETLGLELSKKESYDLCKALDRDGDGTIDVNEFKLALRSTDRERRSSIVQREKKRSQQDQRLARLAKQRAEAAERRRTRDRSGKTGKLETHQTSVHGTALNFVSKKAREYLMKNSRRIIEMFHLMDKSGDGKISRKEFKAGMVLIGIKLRKSDVRALFMHLDEDGDGYIAFREMYNTIKSSDELRRQAVLTRMRSVREIVPTRHTRASRLRLGVLPDENRDSVSPSASGMATATPSNNLGSKGPARGLQLSSLRNWRPAGPVRRLLKASTSLPAFLPSLGSVASLASIHGPSTNDSLFLSSTKKLFRARTPLKPPNPEQWVLRCIIVREGYLEQARLLVQQIVERKARRFGLALPRRRRRAGGGGWGFREDPVEEQSMGHS